MIKGMKWMMVSKVLESNGSIDFLRFKPKS